MADLTQEQEYKIERGELNYPYIFAGVGLTVVVGLIVFLVLWNKSAADIAAIVGVFTSILGTLAGGVFGVKVGSRGSAAAIRTIENAHAATLKSVQEAHTAAVQELQDAHTAALEGVKAQLDATVAQVRPPRNGA